MQNTFFRCVTITRAFRLFVALLLPLAGAGCVMVAVPVPDSKKPAISGRVLKPDDVKFIVRGVTTRAEVISKLGPDFRTYKPGAAISYSWEQKGGDLLWANAIYIVNLGGYGYIAHAEARKTTNAWTYWRALFIDFDSAGVVCEFEFVKLSQRKSVDDQRDAWSAKARAKHAAGKP